MAKQTRQRIVKKETDSALSKFSFSSIIPEKYHTLAAMVLTFVLFLIFFYPMYFGGKTYQSGDILTAQAMVPYINSHTDGFTLWNPLIFLGMPAYALGTSFLWFNMIYLLLAAVKITFGAIFAVEYASWTIYLIMLAVSTFFLVKHLTKNTWVSLLSGLGAAFSTGIIVFLFIGHVTKLTSLCFYPLLLLLLLRMQERIKLLDFLFLVIVLQLFIQGFHVQIIFYVLFTIAIYYIYYFFSFIVRKNIDARNRLIKSSVLFAGAAVIAILIQADNLTQIYEYTSFSTRGTKGIIENTGTAGGNAAETAGTSAFYEYHTNWSFSPGEVLTFIVPSYYGFGTSTYKGPLTQEQEVEVNTYFGQMPFVDVAMYMGVIIFFLGLFAIITRWKEPFVRFLTITAFIALLVSFGSTFPILFDLMFNYFPGFDKFRVPSMFLVIVQLNFPILAGLGVMKIISIRDEKNTSLGNAVKYTAFAFSGLFVLFLLLNSAISTWFIGRVNEFAATLQTSRPQMAQQYQALAEYTSEMFTGDLLIAMAMMAAVFWAAFLYISNKLSRDIFAAVIIVLVVFDLWRINYRGEKLIDVPQMDNMFDTPPNYVNVIKQQNDKEPFRILNLKQDGSIGSFNSNSNYNAYFLLEDFYGYSGIKPRSFQNFMDVIGPVNQSLWRMANVKYVITDRPGMFPGFEPLYQSEKENVYRNNNALPRAFFVDGVQQMKDFDALNVIKSDSVDPKKVAFVEEPLKVDVPDASAYVKITSYGYEKISLDVNATGNNLLFLGNTYMTGEAKYAFIKLPTGWIATIDGNEAPIVKVNHGFMGVVVPKGQHKVEFVYAPASFYISKYMALILSSITVLGAAVLIFLNKKKKVEPEAVTAA